MAKLFPTLIIPLFYKLHKIPNEDLKQRLIFLGSRLGVQVLDVYKIDLGQKTKKANAAVCGLGNTKRILLSDTLIDSFSDKEIEVTLAHELAHHKHQHFWRLTFLNLISMLFGFWVIGQFMQKLIDFNRADLVLQIGIFPILILIYSLYSFLVKPIFNLISRRYEFQADREAVHLTGAPEIFVSLMEKLSRQNLSDPSPPLLIKILFYDHPPVAERVSAAKALENLN